MMQPFLHGSSHFESMNRLECVHGNELMAYSYEFSLRGHKQNVFHREALLLQYAIDDE